MCKVFDNSNRNKVYIEYKWWWDWMVIPTLMKHCCCAIVLYLHAYSIKQTYHTRFFQELSQSSSPLLHDVFMFEGTVDSFSRLHCVNARWWHHYAKYVGSNDAAKDIYFVPIILSWILNSMQNLFQVSWYGNM